MSPVMRRWVVGIGALNVVLFLALVIVLASRGAGSSGDADGSDPGAAATSQAPAPSADGSGPAVEEGATDTATAPATDAATAREAPAGALAVADFTLPSKNISCSLTESEATCWIAQMAFTPPAGDACQWRGQVVVLTGDGVTMPCPQEAPVAGVEGTTVLEYGQTTVVGPWMCTSSNSGLECSSLGDGTGFTLARSAFSSYGPGRLV